MTVRGDRRWTGTAIAVVVALTACSEGPESTSVLTVDATPQTDSTSSASDSTARPSAMVEGAAVERINDSTLRVTWTGQGEVTVRAGTDGASFPDVITTVDTDGVGEIDVPAETDSRLYIRVEAGGGDGVTVAERRVPMEGAHNFRDLGGYAAADGRTVRWGQVFRSGALADLTDADLDIASALGIKLVCDLRSDGEVETEPDPDITGAERVRLSVNDDSVDVQAITEAVLAGDLTAISPDLLLDGMPRIATEFDDLWADLLRRISDPANRPTNVHCSAGKDRAGWASALVLRALGVPEETVMEDYLLSNEFLAEENAERLAQVRTIVAGVNGVPEEEVDLSTLEALLEVRPEYLQAAFDAVDAEWGSFDAYLTEGLGLSADELSALRDSMLE